MKVTICICTHNRAELLSFCLKSILNQSILSGYRLIIIDSSSDNSTEKMVQKFAKGSSIPIDYLRNEIIGLSKSKNIAIDETRTEWLIFLDDDAKADYYFVETALSTISNFEFDCFGGRYVPWYFYGRPSWYKDSYASNGYKTLTVAELPDNLFASGGIMAIRCAVFQTVGKFNDKLGMKGNNLGYGEETNLQVRLRRHGFNIGFNPNFKMDHVVQKYKLSPWWFLRQNYYVGFYSHLTFENSFQLTFFSLLSELFKILYYDLFQAHEKPRFWQNFVVNTFGKMAYLIGQYCGVKFI